MNYVPPNRFPDNDAIEDYAVRRGELEALLQQSRDAIVWRKITWFFVFIGVAWIVADVVGLKQPDSVLTTAMLSAGYLAFDHFIEKKRAAKIVRLKDAVKAARAKAMWRP